MYYFIYYIYSLLYITRVACPSFFSLTLSFCCIWGESFFSSNLCR